MGIEKLYRDDRPMSSREIMSEAYETTVMQNNRSNLVGQPEFKIKEVEGENGEVTFKLVKEPYTKYYLLNHNNVFKTWDDCHNHCFEKVKKHFNEVGENSFLEEHKEHHSSCYHGLSIKEKISYIAVEVTDKEWKRNQSDIRIHKVDIIPKKEKQQVTTIENQDGFKSWFNKSDIGDREVLECPLFGNK